MSFLAREEQRAKKTEKGRGYVVLPPFLGHGLHTHTHSHSYMRPSRFIP